jgi:hypothetical protein
VILSKQQDIDGHAFEVWQLPAKRAVRLTLRIAKLAGPVLMPLLQVALGAQVKDGSKPGAEGALGALLGMDAAVLTPTVEGFFARCSEQDLDFLQSELLSSATMDGAPLWPRYDVALQGQLLTIFKLLWFALQVQFTNFSRGQPVSQTPMTMTEARPYGA